MDFKNLTIIMLLLGLFIFAIMSASIGLTSENNVNNTLMESESINSTFGNLQTQLETTQSTTNGTKSAFEQETPTLGTDSFLFSSIINAGKVFTTLISSIFNLTFGLISEVLGISPIILGVLSAILLLSIILLAWKLYKTGK